MGFTLKFHLKETGRIRAAFNGISNRDSIEISTLRFYTGEFKLYHDDSLLTNEPTYHLIDLSSPATSSIDLPDVHGVNTLSFLLGVDSATQLGGAMSGDLDPAKGMYWTWQSGYIDFKLEGYCIHSDSSVKQIELHIGGYTSPDATQRKVVLNCSGKDMDCAVDLSRIFTDAGLNDFRVMSPGPQAARIADLFCTSMTCSGH
jgi:hypothetical protein